MNDTFACPQCGELLEVPVDLLGRKVRCGACNHAFTPGQLPPIEESIREKSAREKSAREESARDFDRYEPRPRGKYRDSSARAARSNPSLRRFVLFALGGFGLFVFACCGGLAYIAFVMFNPKWQIYESKTGDFVAKFPSAVTPATRFTGRGGERAEAVTARRKLFQEDYFIYFVPLTRADLRKPSEQVLDQLANGFLRQIPGAEEHRPRVERTHGGFDALDICVEHPDGRFTQARIVLANGRGYVLGVTGPGEPDHKMWVEDFLNSFQPRQLPDAKAPPDPD